MINPLIRAFLLMVSGLTIASVHAEEKIHSFTPNSLQQIMASHKDKPFVIVVWSLDCSYCEASFEALANSRQKNKLDVVTISTDRADDPQAASLIRKKFKDSKLDADTWAFGPAPEEQLRYAIDPKWHGEKPRSYWFNAGGEKTAYSGVITAATIEKLSSH